MKFSKKLEQQQDIAIFRGQWVTYRALKHLIKDLARAESSVVVPEVFANQFWWFDSSQKASLGSISPERISFIQIVEYEINKTSQYYASQRKRIADMLFEIQRRLDGQFGLECIIEDIDTIAAELAIFGRFIWQAKALLLKITKKHDKFTQYKVNTWFLVRLEKEEFWNPKLDELVIGVSEAYAVARHFRDKPTEEVQREGHGAAATEDFVRKNEKFFVKPEDVLLVKLIIVRHLPLDIVELSKLKKSSAKKNSVNVDYLSGLQDNCVINSIYLDNDDLVMYHDRTGLRGAKGNIIRIRWYGSYANPPADCFVERKTRQVLTETEYYSIDEAVKERFRVNERNIGGYMSGGWSMDKKLQNMIDKKRISEKESKETLRKATAIQDEIVSKTLRGSLRTVVRRSAFQRGGDQTLRFSLDTNLHIINEKVELEKGKWARNLNMPMRFDEVKTLPYAILEVKTQADAPSWVDELKDSGYLIPAPNFSKFLYGTCKLWPEKVDFTPDWWSMLTDLETTIPGTPALASIHEKISHFGTFAHSKPTFSMGGPKVPLDTPFAPSSSSKPMHKQVVESMYGSSNFLKKSLEMSAKQDDNNNKKKKKVREDLMTTKRSVKRVETNSTLGRQQAKGIQHVVSYSELGRPIIKELPPIPKQPKQEKEIMKAKPEKDYKYNNNNNNNNMNEMTVLKKPEIRVEKEVQKGTFVEQPIKRNTALPPKNKKMQAAEQRAAKVYFANERTLLSWLNTATFLSLTGITLLATETDIGRIAGVALTAVTVLFAIYALIKYLKRLVGLRKKKDADVLYDKYGPIVLIAAFCATLILIGIYYAVNGDGGL